MKKIDFRILSEQDLLKIAGGVISPAEDENIKMLFDFSRLDKNNTNKKAGCVCEYLNASSLTNSNSAHKCSCECIS